MKYIARGLVVLGVIATLGCQQDSSTGSSSTSATSSPQPAASPDANPVAEGSPPPAVTTSSGVKIEELKVGTGAVAEKGKTVAVHYTGWLTDQTKFDSSHDRGQPYTFVLGTGAVIRGWDDGLLGMRVGGRRRLTIPPAMAYGSSANGPIPANSTLVFETELMDVR